MQTQQHKQRQSKPIPWIRLTIASIAVLLFLTAGGIWLLSIGHIIQDGWSYIISVAFAVASGILAVFQWLFPFSPKDTRQAVTTAPVPAAQLSPAPIVATPSNHTTLTPSNDPIYTQPVAPAPVPVSNSQTLIHTPSYNIFYFNVTHLPNTDELYGRKRERITLLDRVRKRASTSIVGPRRIGKTWLLDYVKMVAPAELGTNLRIASLDGTTTRGKTVSDFIAQTLEALEVPLVSDQTNFELDMLRTVVENMQTKNVVPVLCIDEFEGFFNQQDFDCDFFAGLRYIATHGLVLVIVSKSPLIDLVGERCQTSRFFNIFEQITLKPFTKIEAEEFAQTKSRQAGFNNDERIALLEYGRINKQEWPPLRLQLAGGMLLEDKNLAAAGNPEYYQPREQEYWKDFKQRLEETYRGTVR